MIFLLLPILDRGEGNEGRRKERGYEPLVYRMFNFTSTYRAQINFTFEAMDAAKVDAFLDGKEAELDGSV